MTSTAIDLQTLNFEQVDRFSADERRAVLDAFEAAAASGQLRDLAKRKHAIESALCRCGRFRARRDGRQLSRLYVAGAMLGLFVPPGAFDWAGIKFDNVELVQPAEARAVLTAFQSETRWTLRDEAE